MSFDLSNSEIAQLKDELAQNKKNGTSTCVWDTDISDEELYEKYDKAIWNTNYRAAGRKLHIPKNGNALCDSLKNKPTKLGEFYEAPLKREWCDKCKKKYETFEK